MRKAISGKPDPDFNLHDLVIDESDFCRGYGEDTNKYTEKYFENANNDDDDDDEEEEIGEEADGTLYIDDDFKAPEMPEEFYSHVDSFLKRPAPKLHGDDSITKKKDSKSESSIPIFPKINSTKAKELIENTSAEKTVKKPKRKSIKETEFKQERAINNALLREAFAYTDQLLREAVIQEVKEAKEKEKQELLAEQSNHRITTEKVLPKSAPQAETVFGHPIEGATHYSKTQKPSEGGSGVSAIRKLRNKQASKLKGHSNTTYNNNSNNSNSNNNSSHANNSNNSNMQSDFDVSADTEVDLKKNAINFDDLVSNFQNGTTLKKLQKELQQSKQSMQRSEQFLKNLSLEYLNKL